MLIMSRRPGSSLSVVALAVLAVATVGPFAPAAPAAPPPVADHPVATTHVLICAKPGVEPVMLPGRRPSFALGAPRVARGQQRVTSQVADVLRRFGAIAIEPALSKRPANARLASQLGLDRTYRVTVPAGSNTPALAARLAAFESAFEYVEVDGLGGIATTVPDDPLLGQQYGVLNTGQTIQGTPGVPGADVNATSAWDITTGSTSTMLAVLDAGLDLHVDLDGRIVPGWNTANDNADTSDVCISHGTHVAGIAGATGDNDTGIAGLDWKAKIMPVRVLNFCSGNPESWLADGLIWATDNGADVVNMSLQYPTGTATLHNAVLYARSEGVILVSAAGNFGVGGVQYPGKWPETITVAGTNNQDGPYTSSSIGPELTIAAPGQGVYSLLDTMGYQFLSGTSMATPHVAGLVCLMLAVDSNLGHDEVQEILIATAVDLGAPGFDTQFGHGRVDAFDALVEVRRRLGDLDNSGAIDITDLLSLLSQWGPCPTPPAPCPADLDGDGVVSITDLLELLANWSM
ncbi:MAG: S8 family serine peptidase [Planctomycetota bacterium]